MKLTGINVCKICYDEDLELNIPIGAIQFVKIKGSEPFTFRGSDDKCWLYDCSLFALSKMINLIDLSIEYVPIREFCRFNKLYKLEAIDISELSNCPNLKTLYAHDVNGVYGTLICSNLISLCFGMETCYH